MKRRKASVFISLTTVAIMSSVAINWPSRTNMVVATPTQPPAPSPIPTVYTPPTTNPDPSPLPSGLGDHFFNPTAPPSAVPLHTMTGILIGYGFGTIGGGFGIKQDGSGKDIGFAASFPMNIYGKRVFCTVQPVAKGMSADACPDWPANLILGTTDVKVTYWNGIDQFGNSALLSNTIAQL